MMKKRRSGFIAVVAVILLLGTLTWLVGCSKNNRGNQLDSVDANSIKIVETNESFAISWHAVTNADKYKLEITGNETIVSDYLAINLRSVQGFTFPASGEFTISITAQGDGYADSAPTTIPYKTEGVQLASPEITAFENGVIQWKPSNAVASYEVKVDNVTVSANASDCRYDLSSLTGLKRVEIIAHGDEVWTYSSGATALAYNASSKALEFLPVTDCSIKDDKLVWGAVGGAKAYKVVDIEMNSVTVTDTSYDIADKLLIYGVYPISGKELINSATVQLAPIKYLDGEGTAQNPYKIKTILDLRTIDYYETIYAEQVASNKNLPRNVYELQNDIDYSYVPVGDDETNIHTLKVPFFGTLDGKGHTLKNVRVANYDGGYWSLFDRLVQGSTVKDIVFDSPEISTKLQDEDHPINTTIATVAYYNYGTVSGITITNAKYAAAGGEIAGIVAHNYGTVSDCTLGGTFKIEDTELEKQACYEVAGIVLENLKGGKVTNNTVTEFTAVGTTSKDATKKSYYNLGMVGGIVAYARAGSVTTGNKYTKITVTNANASSYTVGGIIASNASGTQNGNTAGELTANNTKATATTGSGSRALGTLIGKTASV
ncbi:MAG: hypothetical protein HDT28_00820 [Clostridiales bacterium]|nr:hypothetical protein [Clostridiales bacterium]